MEVKNYDIALSKEKSELGKDFIQNGKFSEAEKVLKQAVDLNPKNADAHFWQGVLLFNQDDYLTKPFSVEELLARLRVMQRRFALLQADTELGESSVYVNGNLKIDLAAGCAYKNDEELKLTPIEYKLLCLLAKNTGKVLTHKYITQKIWGSAWDSNVASLRVFMATLRKKLENEKLCTIINKIFPKTNLSLVQLSLDITGKIFIVKL